MASDVDLKVYLNVLRKWYWLMAFVTAIAATSSYVATSMMPRTYETSVTLMVGEETANARLSLEDISLSQRVAAIYAGMVKRQPVMEATVNALGLDVHWRELQTRVLPIRRDGSQVLEIRVADTDPQRVKAIAEEIARQLILQSPTSQNLAQLQAQRDFIKRQLDTIQADIQRAETTMAEKQAALVTEVSARGVLDLQDEIKALDLKLNNWRTTYASLLASVESKSPSSLSVIEPAYVPSWPVGPNLRANVLMATVVAGLLALGAVLFIEYHLGFDRLNGTDDVSRMVGLPTLGAIAILESKKEPREAPIAATEPHSPAAEAYRFLRTNVRFTSRDQKSPILLVTSPGVGEGKTTTVANLGVSFAQAGKRTVIVDADLRQPSLHTWFGLSNDGGLSTLLDGKVDGKALSPAEHLRIEQSSVPQSTRGPLEAYLLETPVPGLSLIPAGPAPTISPAELIASPAMSQILRELRGTADVVILDSPPILPVTDVALLAAMDTRVLIVVQAGRTTGQAMRESVEVLRRAEATVLGAVLVRVPTSNMPYYRYSAVEKPRESDGSLAVGVSNGWGAETPLGKQRGRGSGLAHRH